MEILYGLLSTIAIFCSRENKECNMQYHTDIQEKRQITLGQLSRTIFDWHKIQIEEFMWDRIRNLENKFM
jgi:hypothetical protein